GHHRRRVNQGGNRRGTFHRVRQPDIQRYLRGLAGGADEQQQRRDRQRAEHSFRGERRDGGRNPLEVERAEANEQQQRAEDERVVPDAVDDERLLAGVGGRLLLEP